MESAPVSNELASLVQTGHIKQNPDPDFDVNPSTAASQKVPLEVIQPDLDEISSQSSIPSDIIRPASRRPSHRLPLIDLRFEQTYLNSIKNAENNWQVALITIKDQVLLPLVQGMAYRLVVAGWRYMNRGTKFRGTSMGARVRKWWWGVNGWKIPDERAERAREYFTAQSGTSLGD